jgi:hypothetical protein
LAPKPDPKRDEPVKIDLDPEAAFRALLAVDPSSDAAVCECGHPFSVHARTPHGKLTGVMCEAEACQCHFQVSADDQPPER